MSVFDLQTGSVSPSTTYTQFALDGTHNGMTAFDAGKLFRTLGTRQQADIPTGDYPAQTDVRNSISYASGSLTGNMTEPAESDVRSGVDYGANGTEFTGTLATGGGEVSYTFVS